MKRPTTVRVKGGLQVPAFLLLASDEHAPEVLRELADRVTGGMHINRQISSEFKLYMDAAKSFEAWKKDHP